ncbi:MAG: LPS assembly protein LptD, partial [Verrucomicrobiia bacterium]
LGISPFYYESESSGAFLRFCEGDYFAATNHSAFRADSFQQLLLPQTLFGWLNLTPRASGRFTYYGAEEDTGFVSDEHRRWVFNTGIEGSFKASRVWRDARNPLLDVTELRHIIEPSINYSYTPAPSARPPELPQFDYEWYSYEMRPIDFPDYNSIDGIDSQNVIRFGLHNKLQTKRRGNVDDLVNWAAFVDWRLRPQKDQSTFADIFSDLDFKPRSWITLNSEMRYDVNENLIRVANHTATIEPNDVWSWKIGHRYVREIEELGPGSGHSLIMSSIYLRLSQNYGFRFRHHFDIKHHVMQEQYYTLYRDFRSWTGALTFRLRDNGEGNTDFAVAVQLSLKAFPRFGLGQDSDEPDRLLGW